MATQRKILVVDDDPDIRNLIRLNLEFSGYTVLETDSGVKVRSLIREHRPDVVLLDIFMEDKEGLETLGEIHRNDPAPAVIVITAHADYGEIALEMGADGLLTKPFDMQELVQTIEKLSTG